MISAGEYGEQRKNLMEEYETTVRTWLTKKGGISAQIADIVPFFRDGVTCPSQWFVDGNDFRPLFIMKEPSMGFSVACEEEIPDRIVKYNEDWGKKADKRYFEFAENPFDDIRVGSYNTWRRVARLALGLEHLQAGGNEIKYDFDVAFVPSEEKCTEEFYKDTVRTGNETYKTIIDRIAVIDIKKIGGGNGERSILSKAGQHYLRYLDEPMKDLLKKQIILIDPTVIICCGVDVEHIQNLFEDEIKDVIWLKTYHPAVFGKYGRLFFERALTQYKQVLQR